MDACLAALIVLLEQLAYFAAFIVLWPFLWLWATLFTLAGFLCPRACRNRQIMPRTLFRVLMMPGAAMRDRQPGW